MKTEKQCILVNILLYVVGIALISFAQPLNNVWSFVVGYLGIVLFLFAGIFAVLRIASISAQKSLTQ